MQYASCYILWHISMNMETNQMTYTEKLQNTVFKVGDNPAGVDGEAFDTEIEHSLTGLMALIKEHWNVDLHGDDRAFYAYEAIAKWVVESLEDAEVK